MAASPPKRHAAERPPRDKQAKEAFLIINTVKEERDSKSNQRKEGGW
jgi:hypothetical protein